MEESKKKILISLVIVSLIAVAVFIGLWLTTEAERNELLVERNELLDKLALSTIVGWAYVDHGTTIEALDNADWRNEGFKVQLYRIGKESVLIQEGQVDDHGQYQFTVEQPGIYYVVPVYGIQGYPGWDQIVCLRDPGNILVEEGGYHDGPIFLVRENGRPKG